MPLGVSLDEVWGENSLVSRPPHPKKSKYTTPINGNRVHDMAGNYQRDGLMALEKEYMTGAYTNRGRNDHSQHSRRDLDSFPVSGHGLEERDAASFSPPQPSAQEIPYLREQLTQQNSTVVSCQKEVAYLKAVVKGLKKELYAQQQKSQQQSQTQSSKKSWMECMYIVLQLGLLLLVVILLIRLTQKMDKILQVPVLGNI